MTASSSIFVDDDRRMLTGVFAIDDNIYHCTDVKDVDNYGKLFWVNALPGVRNVARWIRSTSDAMIWMEVLNVTLDGRLEPDTNRFGTPMRIRVRRGDVISAYVREEWREREEAEVEATRDREKEHPLVALQIYVENTDDSDEAYEADEYDECTDDTEEYDLDT